MLLYSYSAYPSNTDNSRIVEFESLRGLMAIWVMMGHVALTFNIPNLEANTLWKIIGENGRAVNVFITLSGFVIFHLLNKEDEKYERYIARRFLRLFPSYLVCLLLSVAMLYPSIEALLSIEEPTTRTLQRIAIFQASLTDFWSHLVAHLTLLHGLIPQHILPFTDYAFIGQAWSISVEWQFYLIAPIAFFLITKPKKWVGLPILAIICIIFWVARYFFGLGFVGARVEYFIIGCASFFFWKSGRLSEKIAIYTRIFLFIPIVCAVLVLARPQQWELAIWLCVLLSCNAMRFPKPGLVAKIVSGILLTTVARRLGQNSYSIYCVHMIILYGILWLTKSSGWSQTLAMLVTMLLTLIGTVSAANFLYRWVEAPCIAFGRCLPRHRSIFRILSKT